MKIEYGEEASDSFMHAIDAMQGYTVRLECTSDGSANARAMRRNDVELIGLTTDDEGGQWLTYYPTDADGGQYGLGDPHRKVKRIEFDWVESLYVY